MASNIIEKMVVQEKIYVALGNEMQEEEALLTLNWVLSKWSTSSSSSSSSQSHHHHPFSIVILFITASSSSPNLFVYTPFGKLPASSVSDDKLQILRKCQRHKIDQLLTKYIAYCGKVKAEVHKIDKQNEAIERIVVDLITEHRITKLVVGMTFMRSPSGGRSKSAISGSFYVHRNKPDYCELYVLCRGKLVVLREENDEDHIEDEQGVVLEKLKHKASLKDWFGKMLNHGHGKSPICPSPMSSTTSIDSGSPLSINVNQWEKREQEIEEYLKELLGSNSRKGKETVERDELGRVNSPSEQNNPDCVEDVSVRIEALKKDIQAAVQIIEVHRNGAKAEVDRQAKALWAICLCNHRTEELEARITEEIATRNDITKEIDNTKEQLCEILTDVQDSRTRLTSLLELQSELSSKLQVSSLAKLGAEAKLEQNATARAELVTEIEELRKQRDVFQRRIEFCKEKDAIEVATRMSSDLVSCGYREFSVEEIRLATENFAKFRRLTCGRDCTGAYKGRINRLSVAIQVLDPEVDLSRELFQAKVSLLANIRHPHIVSFIGFCSEPKCFAFEYMHNGCLRDILFSRTRSRTLQWHQRIQIMAQVSIVLGFLHLAHPRPIVYGGVNPSCVFLDRNLVVKLHPLELILCSNGDDAQADVIAFGDLLLQLLTGRNWSMLDRETVINKQAILAALDESAGDWPANLAEEIVGLAMKCRSVSLDPDAGLTMSSVTKELKELKKKADDTFNRREYHMGADDGLFCGEESINVPAIFICPIFKVVMDNPHIAADGHSYELEAIEEWLRMGHNTSPVTNQKLNHKHLVPNKNLRFLIEDWRSSSS